MQKKAAGQPVGLYEGVRISFNQLFINTYVFFISHGASNNKQHSNDESDIYNEYLDDNEHHIDNVDDELHVDNEHHVDHVDNVDNDGEYNYNVVF